MTPEQIKEQRDWLDTLTRYTPGPWRVSYERGTTQIRSADNDSLMCDETYYPWVPDNQNDWTIIAAAPDLRDRYAAALDEIERLREAMDKLSDTDLTARQAAIIASAALRGEGQFGNGAQCKKCGGDMIQGAARIAFDRPMFWATNGAKMDSDQEEWSGDIGEAIRDMRPDASAALDKLIAEAVQAEREACAKIAETEGVSPETNVYAGGPDWLKHGRRIAAAIRNRGREE